MYRSSLKFDGERKTYQSFHEPLYFNMHEKMYPGISYRTLRSRDPNLINRPRNTSIEYRTYKQTKILTTTRPITKAKEKNSVEDLFFRDHHLNENREICGVLTHKSNIKSYLNIGLGDFVEFKANSVLESGYVQGIVINISYVKSIYSIKFGRKYKVSSGKNTLTFNKNKKFVDKDVILKIVMLDKRKRPTHTTNVPLTECKKVTIDFTMANTLFGD